LYSALVWALELLSGVCCVAELAAEKLGRQMLDAITGVLPQSIARHVA
jgi:hypothetical protein